MTTDRLIAQATALGVAAFLTLSILAGIDTLAVGQHAATTQAAAAQAASAAAAAHTAAARTAAPRS